MNKLEQRLIDSGYKYYDLYGNTDESDALYQKVTRDTLNRKLYYLNAYYEAPKQLSHILLPEIIKWEVQLHLPNGNYFDLVYYTTDINDAEHFFEKMFDSMECVPEWCAE